MLPGKECRAGSMSEFLIWLLHGRVREGAANLAEDVNGRNGVRPSVGILQQRRERFARVSVSDSTAERTPQPLDPIGLGVVRRRVHQDELATQVLEQFSQQEAAFGRV